MESRTISCTCTVGAGSEQHNHSLKFREALDHVTTKNDPNAIIELIPYVPYKKQINELMLPYIQEYNKASDARFEAAKERYRSGQIKSRPKRRDYPTMDEDYCKEHEGGIKYANPRTKKTEIIPLWREVIFGLGDMNDRKTGAITKEEAVAVMTDVVKRWPKLFPDFKLLGATIHLDEKGFYHCHIDYKPLYEKSTPERGLKVGIGHDGALEHMGFTKEQSIINESDKAPILFNAFRNKLYRTTEQALIANGLRLQYGVSATKEPGKDSSTNQQMDAWQATQDATRELQRQKNVMLDVVMSDEVSPEGYKKAIEAADSVVTTLDEISKSPRSRLKKDKVVVEFRLFDQLRSFVTALVDSVKHLLHRIDVLSANVDYYADQAARAEKEVERLKPKEQELHSLRIDYRNRDAQAQRAEAEVRRQRQFMHQFKVEGKPMDEIYQEQQLREQRQRERSR